VRVGGGERDARRGSTAVEAPPPARLVEPSTTFQVRVWSPRGPWIFIYYSVRTKIPSTINAFA